MRSERAKIFAPFSPLRGLDEAYRAKERVIVPKAELLCDRIEEINIKLKALQVGYLVKTTYYFEGRYKIKIGRIKSILPNKNMLVMDIPIKFSDIYDIEVLNKNRQ